MSILRFICINYNDDRSLFIHLRIGYGVVMYQMPQKRERERGKTKEIKFYPLFNNDSIILVLISYELIFDVGSSIQDCGIVDC